MSIELQPTLLAGALTEKGDRRAVVDRHRSITFAELDEQSARLSNWLKSNVIGEYVMLVCNHSVDDVVAHVGALRAGKVLVPIDAREPDRRLRDVATSLGCDIVLAPTSDRFVDGVRCLEVADAVAGGDYDATWHDWEPDDIAWLYFTSGSTGEPRAIPLPVGRRVPDQFMSTEVQPSDRVGATRPLGFMAGGTAVLAALAHRGCAYLLDLATMSASAFLDAVDADRITRLDVPTSLLRTDEEASRHGPIESVEEIRVIGERCLAEDLRVLRQIFPKARIANSYGASEFGTISRFVVSADQPIPDDPVPAGRPMREVLILDDDLNPVPPGQIGRLATSTPHPAPGYLESGSLVPLETVELRPGVTAVVSGDNAYFDDDGVLFVVGRRDDFVKINGQLVNVGAVQAAVMRHPDVVDAAVAAFEGGGGRTRLGAVVQVRAGAVVTSRDIRQFLAGELAGYMIPARMIVGDSVPHGLRGKTDRLRVAEMLTDGSPQTYVSAIGDPITWKIVSCLNRFVDTGGVLAAENLQYCGLDSLDAVEFVEMLSQKLGVPIPMSLLVGEWSLSSLRAWVLGHGDRVRSRLVTVVHGSNPTKLLWVMPGMNVIGCVPLASNLTGYSSSVFVNRGADSRLAPFMATDAIAHDLFGEFLRRSCDSNTALIGFSSAAWVAHRLAQLMTGAGIGPRLLVMIDPPTLEQVRTSVGALDGVRLMLAREGELPFEPTAEFDQQMLTLQMYGLRHHQPTRYEGRSLLIVREGRDGHEAALTEVLRDPSVFRCGGGHLELIRDPMICGPAISRELANVLTP